MKLEHRFVEYMPDRLENGVLYVSTRFRIASHNCCCGCGNEVVLSLSPRTWKLIFDGETVSLRPSIGNWKLDCKSHYWISNNTVEWAETWEDMKRREARGSAKQGKVESPAGLEGEAAKGSVSLASKKKGRVLEGIRRLLK
jgi:uncharacterized protein DUF6527